MSSSSDKTRSNLAFVVTIALGLFIGLLIKRVSIGLLIGLALGLLASVFAKRN